MLMSPNKGETAVHGCHCTGDLALRLREVLARLNRKLFGKFYATFEIFSNFCDFRQLLKFWATFDFFLAFLKLIFTFFATYIYYLSKEKSAKFNWFILLCECVDSRIGPSTNASLVLHAYQWS